MSFFFQIDELLLNVYYLYHNSPKKWRELKQLAEMCQEAIVKPVRSHGSRWAAHKLGALRALVRDYVTIVTHMEDMSSGERRDIKPTEVCRLKGYLKKLKSLRFVYHCHFFIDVFQILSKLSLAFQSDDVPIYQVADQMDSAIVDLVLLKNVDGENLKSFRGKIEMNDDTCVFGRVTLRLSGQCLQLCDDKRGTLIDSVTSCIERRYDSFEKDPVISACRTILNCPHWPRDDNVALADYGNEEIAMIGNHFSDVLVANGCIPNRLLPEWLKLKRHIKRYWQASFGSKGGMSAWKILFETWEETSNDFTNVLHLIQILLVLPVASAHVERCFSLLKRILGDWRLCLGTQTIEKLMHICLDGPPIEEFQAQVFVTHWLNSGVRSRRTNIQPYGQRKQNDRTPSQVQHNEELHEVITIADLFNSDDEDDNDFEGFVM